MSAPAARPALFLDRDGVVNVDFGYVHRADQVVFVDGIFDLCRAAQREHYAIVIVTNQAGIARGLYTEQHFHELMAWIGAQFLDSGVVIDGVYHCPHHPEHGIGILRQSCLCRKPAAGLFLEAARDLSLDVTRSILIGDKMSDIEAGRRAGVATRVLLSSADAGGLIAEELVLPSLRAVHAQLFA
jgi:D-glycero-D-manno-heptose 1,7-bisphosphate phosphatase